MSRRQQSIETAMTEKASLPLARFRVLDLTQARAGPTAVRQLADWGADVLMIEAPDAVGAKRGLGQTRHDFDFQNLHRNKRSATLNLKTEEGKQVFFDLVKRADVVVENYRPDVKHRLGIDYEACAKVNPRIVYGSISGFGQTGPYANRPGFDQIAQGMGGLMSITGLPGQGPVRVGIAIADLTSGYLLAQAILVALLEREQSGQGQWVHSSLLAAQIQLLDFQASKYLMTGEVPRSAGNDHPTIMPQGLYPTATDDINIAVGGESMWEKCCVVLEAPEMRTDSRFATSDVRSTNRAALNEAISAKTRQQPAEHWIAEFNAAGIPCGPVLTIDKVFADPQVEQLQMAVPVQHPVLGTIRLTGQAAKMERTPASIRSATPERGQHTGEVLGELGYDDRRIRLLRERQAI
jgi:crotonobetainyl-CoA:carnitine CoA-transferase CaiB-like acyl-CoA transferase